MEIDDNEWVSVSTIAKREGITTQMVYVRIRNGMYETRQFQRGKMKGWLVKVPNNHGIEECKILQDSPEG